MTRISERIHTVWSEFSLYAQYEAKNPRFFHADEEDSDQTVLMPWLTWVFAGRTELLFVVLQLKRIVIDKVLVEEADSITNN